MFVRQEVGEERVADLRRQPERPALDEFHDLGSQLWFRFLAHTAPALSQAPQLLNRVEDLIPVDHPDRVAQQTAEQANISG